MTDYILPAAMIAFPFVGNIFGSIITRKNMPWYDKLKKPSWCPPKWVFPVVWPILYGAMGYASYVIIRDVSPDKAMWPIGLYSTQLALNWFWTPIFFGAHKIRMASVEIVLLTSMATATMVSFKSVSNQAFYLMIPYLTWLLYATTVQFGVDYLNPEDEPSKKTQ